MEKIIEGIETCLSLGELRRIFQVYIESKGFSHFTFVDVSRDQIADPVIVNTIPSRWDDDYRNNGFIDVDPCLPIAKRSNVPFTWTSVPLPERTGKRRPGALRVMEAARDFGFRNGLVVPLHYRDAAGVYYSSICTLFWSGRQLNFIRRLMSDRAEVHMVLLYWAQRVIDLSARDSRRRPSLGDRPVEVKLTDREMDVLKWAAAGKTGIETATILGISRETVEGYSRGAIGKLDAANKTHAVARALSLGLIVL
jgi:LuxR family transcriptional regulator, quorum-sensing system regulator BjaR1